MKTRKFYLKTSALAAACEYKGLGWDCYLCGDAAPFEVRAMAERPTGKVEVALSVDGYMEDVVAAT